MYARGSSPRGARWLFGRKARSLSFSRRPGGIAESNIRRTFTVRFPNLYCVWQRCRDIRGSYRNVLLLIVLQAEGSGRGRRVARAERGRKVGKEGRFGRRRKRETAGRKRDRNKGEGKRIYGKQKERRGTGREGERQREGQDERKRDGKREGEKRERERERSGNTACTGAFDRPMN